MAFISHPGRTNSHNPPQSFILGFGGLKTNGKVEPHMLGASGKKTQKQPFKNFGTIIVTL